MFFNVLSENRIEKFFWPLVTCQKWLFWVKILENRLLDRFRILPQLRDPFILILHEFLHRFHKTVRFARPCFKKYEAWKKSKSWFFFDFLSIFAARCHLDCQNTFNIARIVDLFLTIILVPNMSWSDQSFTCFNLFQSALPWKIGQFFDWLSSATKCSKTLFQSIILLCLLWALIWYVGRRKNLNLRDFRKPTHFNIIVVFVLRLYSSIRNFRKEP